MKIMNCAILILLSVVLIMTTYNEIQIRKISRKLNFKIKAKDLLVYFDWSKKNKTK